MLDTENIRLEALADKYVEIFLGEDGDRVAKAAVLGYMVGVDRGKSLKPAPPAA